MSEQAQQQNYNTERNQSPETTKKFFVSFGTRCAFQQTDIYTNILSVWIIQATIKREIEKK